MLPTRATVISFSVRSPHANTRSTTEQLQTANPFDNSPQSRYPPHHSAPPARFLADGHHAVVWPASQPAAVRHMYDKHASFSRPMQYGTVVLCEYMWRENINDAILTTGWANWQFLLFCSYSDDHENFCRRYWLWEMMCVFVFYVWFGWLWFLRLHCWFAMMNLDRLHFCWGWMDFFCSSQNSINSRERLAV